MALPSKGELKIAAILDAAGLPYKQEYSFPDLVASSGRPLRFDFAVFDDNGEIFFLIEYQGEQHYEAVNHFKGKKGLSRQKYNAQQKRKYCAEHAYPLIAVPYRDFERLNYNYLMEKVISYL